MATIKIGTGSPEGASVCISRANGTIVHNGHVGDEIELDDGKYECVDRQPLTGFRRQYTLEVGGKFEQKPKPTKQKATKKKGK